MLYYRPHNLEDALSWLSANGARVAAGCTDLFPSTQAPELEGPILDVTAIDGMRGVSIADDAVQIGGATTWRDVVDATLPPAFDGLKLAAREIGSVQIQNAGTIAGNLCTASPAADSVPCLLALDAEVQLTSLSGTRRLPLSDFITGYRETACRADEIVSHILIPRPASEGKSTFLKLGARKYLIISIAMVAGRLVERGGTIEEIALSVGACSAVATRLSEVEDLLKGKAIDTFHADAITDDMVGDALSPIDDVRADAGYRVKCAAELTRRVVRELMA